MKQIKGWHLPDIDGHFKAGVAFGKFPKTTYQQKILSEAMKHVPVKTVAIDIGANVGLHSVRFALDFDEVHSFEPTPMNLECLTKNTETFDNVTLYDFALSDIEGSTEIKLPKSSDNCGAFSITDFSEQSDTHSFTIRTKTLDSLNLNPDFIKIDVQGFEKFVLRGAIETINRCKPVIITEASTPAEVRIMESFFDEINYKQVAKIKKDTIWKSK